MIKKIQILFVIMIMLASCHEFYQLSTIIQPIASNPIENNQSNILRTSLTYLGCPRHKMVQVEDGIRTATDRTGISSLLLASLIYTESNFRSTVISNKGYKGLAQTPTATMIYAEVDILHGAMILKDKLRLTKGNIFEALAKYKGGSEKPEARKQAQYVMKVYDKLVRTFV